VASAKHGGPVLSEPELSNNLSKYAKGDNVTTEQEARRKLPDYARSYFRHLCTEYQAL
jgi:hypothetical protein